ncbi:hypothetical protein B0H13DRAFT_1868402 [Mycena leptocephala]|nr:hypothetical protein B0H13DRAFT_1868402 [Mycena leptocephala]
MYHRAFLLYLTALVFLVSAAPPVPGKSAQLEQLKGRAYIPTYSLIENLTLTPQRQVFEGSGTCAATACSSKMPCTGKVSARSLRGGTDLDIEIHNHKGGIRLLV